MAQLSVNQSLGLFSGMTAWFSSCVPQLTRDLWRDNGGKETNVDVAVMVFSDDANNSDTKSLYSSKAYMTDNLAIFHSSYIDTCVKNDSVRTVSIGKFLLPPVELYEKIKDMVEYGYAYTYSDNSEPSQGHIEINGHNQRVNDNYDPSNQVQLDKAPDVHTDYTEYPGYVRIEDLPAVKGVLRDFEIGSNSCEVIKR